MDGVNATKSVSTSVTYGGKVVYTCRPLHVRVSGHLVRKCLADGNFSGSPLVCAEGIDSFDVVQIFYQPILK